MFIYLFNWLCRVLVSGIFCCGMWDLVPWPGIELMPPALGTQSLSHWTTGKSWVFFQFSSVQSLSPVQLFATPRTTAHQFITNSRSLPKLMSIESVMPSNHLILCCPLLLLPSIFPSIRVFSNESALRIRWPKYCSFSFNMSFQWTLRTDLL